MPRRTAEASKAIRLAWQRELELVQEGKGTRDWTEVQQRDILNPELGKAYDEDGKAFEGHHMKSAEAYPEYQGDPDNIQFLSRTEHTQVHGGWRKPTNGYYDYITGITYDFEEDGLIPCKVISLSYQVIVPDVQSVDTEADMLEETQLEQSSEADPPVEIPTDKQPSVSKPTKSTPVPQTSKGSVLYGIVNAVNAVKNFSDKHPVLKTVVAVGLGITAAVVTGKVVDTKIKTKPFGSASHSLVNKQTVKSITGTAVDVISKFDFKKSESKLKQLGYTVAKTIGLSDSERQKILQRVIDNGVMSKDAICDFLKNNINLHKNQTTFAEAIDKWMTDLAFLKNVSFYN